jgi:hypothetical protein
VTVDLWIRLEQRGSRCGSIVIRGSMVMVRILFGPLFMNDACIEMKILNSHHRLLPWRGKDPGTEACLRHFEVITAFDFLQTLPRLFSQASLAQKIVDPKSHLFTQ